MKKCLIIITAILLTLGLLSCGNSSGDSAGGDITNPCAHTGGEATCTVKAVCTLCDQEYGETAPHSVDAWSVSKHPASLDELNNERGEESGTCEICNNTVRRALTAENYKKYFYHPPPETFGAINNSIKGLPYNGPGGISVGGDRCIAFKWGLLTATTSYYGCENPLFSHQPTSRLFVSYLTQTKIISKYDQPTTTGL